MVQNGELVDQFSDWGVRILGFLVKENNPGLRTFCGAPVLGTFGDLIRVLHGHPVDEVVFALPTKDLEDVREMIDIYEVEGGEDPHYF